MTLRKRHHVFQLLFDCMELIKVIVSRYTTQILLCSIDHAMIRTSQIVPVLKKIAGSKRVLLFCFRVLLGLALIYKGIHFIQQEEHLEKIIVQSEKLSGLTIPKILIPWLHLIGGFFISIGVYTRFMILVQLPLIAGALILFFTTNDATIPYSEMYFASAILLLQVIYFIFGDGFYSWRLLLKKEKDSGHE